MAFFCFIASVVGGYTSRKREGPFPQGNGVKLGVVYMPEFTTPQIISIVIFIVVFALIISEKVHRTVAALAGAVVLILTGILSFDTGMEHIDFGTLGVLVGMMIFVAVVKNSGIFEYIAIRTSEDSEGQPVGDHGAVLPYHRCSFRVLGQRHHGIAYWPRYLHGMQDARIEPRAFLHC